VPFKKLFGMLAPGAKKTKAMDAEATEEDLGKKEAEEKKKKARGVLMGGRGMSRKEFEELDKASR